MAEKHYTVERGTQCLISLLKAHGVRKVIASPGTTNIVFVGSVQSDPWFEVYSSVDERSAAYIACGMAAESGEPVVIVCTGATASRNYLSGLTEAYYRKLPVIAVTYNAGIQRKHHLIAQQIDRDVIQRDVARMAVNIPIVKDAEDAWYCNVEINKALLETRHHGGGPVHINISTNYSRDFSAETLPEERLIERILPTDAFPAIPKGKIAIAVGSHRPFSKEETEAIDSFCSAHNAVVVCDHTSAYHGRFRVQSSLIGCQRYAHCLRGIKLLIHLGEVSGDYSAGVAGAETVWRVNPDGEIKDTYRQLRYVFEMSELEFFKAYGINSGTPADTSFLAQCEQEYNALVGAIPELPFSNVWIAQHTAPMIPTGSVIHFGILNSLRAWNLFKLPTGVESYSNVGGFGIDGILSTALGASLANPDKPLFAVLGDLAFFYDLNSLGNRHRLNNLHIMLINNGRGTEFTNFNHMAASFGSDADRFMAAGGHFGQQSPQLVKHFASDLGFKYLSAKNKEEYLTHVKEFTSPQPTDQPIIFEVFTDSTDESDALKTIYSLKSEDSSLSLSGKIKNVVGNVIGDKGRKIIRIIRE